MDKKVILVLGSLVAVLVFCAPFIFSAMKANDYNKLKSGIQDAKRRAGMWIEEDHRGKRVESYEERYLRGDYSDL